MIDYDKERRLYKPKKINTLLIGEAPPPNGKTFFYIPKHLSLAKDIKNDTSLPATIFNHYFGKRPENIKEYTCFLESLKSNGIFLLDILDEPLKIRENKTNELYLINQLPNLRKKITLWNIDTPEENWIFLLARTSYKKYINIHFPKSSKVRWIDFRMKPQSGLHN